MVHEVLPSSAISALQLQSRAICNIFKAEMSHRILCEAGKSGEEMLEMLEKVCVGTSEPDCSTTVVETF